MCKLLGDGLKLLIVALAIFFELLSKERGRWLMSPFTYAECDIMAGTLVVATVRFGGDGWCGG